MKRYKTSWWRLLLAAMVYLSACTTNDIDPNKPYGSPPSKGTAEFTKYVAVGNSLTAGFADAIVSGGGFYREGQLNSYPNILSVQVSWWGKLCTAPFSEEPAVGSGYNKLARLPLVTNPTSLFTAFATVAPGAVWSTT